MSIVAALDDARAALAAGESPDIFLGEVAEAYGVSVTMLTNRLRTAVGDFSTYAARMAAIRAAVSEETATKLALGETRAAIAALGEVPTDSTSAARLRQLCEHANSLGGNFTIKTIRRKR